MIPRCKDQKEESLEEFYRRSVAPAIGGRMIRLLEALEASLGQRSVWGLTAASQLWLLNQDDAYSPEWVSISTSGPDHYQVTVAYWQSSPRRWIERMAGNERDAVRMILAAMRDSGGWPEG